MLLIGCVRTVLSHYISKFETSCSKLFHFPSWPLNLNKCKGCELVLLFLCRRSTKPRYLKHPPDGYCKLSIFLLLVKPVVNMSWVGGLFDNAEIDFPDSTTWAVIETIQSKVMRDFDEERTILRCRQVGSPLEGKEAIIKVHMQYVLSRCASSVDRYLTGTTNIAIAQNSR